MAGDDKPLSTLTWIGSDRRLPRRVARPVLRFLNIEAAGGVLLIAATVVALAWVNSPWSDSYHELWETKVTIEVGDFSLDAHEDVPVVSGADAENAVDAVAPAGEAVVPDAGSEESHGISLEALVNDALMAIFFFVVGLEIKRELVVGDLKNPRDAMLPALAALGGMVVPALLYLTLNSSGAATKGWGIPMATDIAFAVGVVSLLGSRVPSTLKVFLLTLAIVDDIGAIIVIALFYTSDISLGWLAVAAGLVALVALMKQVKIWHTPVYVAVGFFVWLAVFESGIHATIAGVVLGIMAPARPLQIQAPHDVMAPVMEDVISAPRDARRASFFARESTSVAERLEDTLHPFSSFIIIPIFALANAGIELSGDTVSSALSASVTIGVVLGLVVGKTIGITLFTLGGARFGLPLPAGVSRLQVVGIAAVAGVGFTVSIFVTGLAFDSVLLQDEAKIGILVASILAAIFGTLLLRAGAARIVPGDDDFDPSEPLAPAVSQG